MSWNVPFCGNYLKSVADFHRRSHFYRAEFSTIWQNCFYRTSLPYPLPPHPWCLTPLILLGRIHPSPPPPKTNQNNIFWGIFFFISYCWDRCNWCIGSQTLKPLGYRSHPQWERMRSSLVMRMRSNQITLNICSILTAPAFMVPGLMRTTARPCLSYPGSGR